jgi:ornithine cyclodeaminase
MTTLRLLSGADVRRLLPMEACVALMERTLVAVSSGEASIPLRTVMALPGGRGRMGLMPGALAGAGFGIKLLSLFPDNPAAGLSSHLGLVLLFEPQHGRPVALIDAAEVTAIRTAAVSALATRLLAREDAGDLAILGSGEQAASHLEAMAGVRDLRRVRVWSRSADHAQAFAARHGTRAGVGVEAVSTVREAVAGADIICTVTAAREPVLHGAWVAPGAHVNAVGASTPNAAEIDAALLLRSRLFVDLRASAEAEAGEYLQARQAGLIGADHIVGELGELAAGRVAGRRSEEEITLFKSLGIAAEDLAVARFLLDRAEALGEGQTVDI